MVRALGSSIAVSPPLICTREHLDLIGDAISGALAETVGLAPARPTT
jgi:adenosylmethionine-8-amino-7-oxononanoate aminotransferase